MIQDERNNLGAHPVVLFDGVCNLCNSIVQFVIRRDPAPAKFRFAALQSEEGQRLLAIHGLPQNDLDSFVLVDRGRAYVRSAASLRTLKILGFPWSLLYIFIIIPRPLRDAVYRWIARNRYRWFGKRDACMMPTPDVQARFIG